MEFSRTASITSLNLKKGKHDVRNFKVLVEDNGIAKIIVTEETLRFFDRHNFAVGIGTRLLLDDDPTVYVCTAIDTSIPRKNLILKVVPAEI